MKRTSHLNFNRIGWVENTIIPQIGVEKTQEQLELGRLEQELVGPDQKKRKPRRLMVEDTSTERGLFVKANEAWASCVPLLFGEKRGSEAGI